LHKVQKKIEYGIKRDIVNVRDVERYLDRDRKNVYGASFRDARGNKDSPGHISS
jgi:hypothetical protein